ncbi:MAG: DUF4129 domain-containing protein [Acidobacteriota bacterium]|nr:DUF4129 domain-containing protein [Acidobacteriota bacterium]
MRTSLNRLSHRPTAVTLTLGVLLVLSSVAARAQKKAAPKSTPSGVGRAAASTPAQYRARVHDCVAPLEELAAFCEELSRGEKPEVWSKEDFDPDVALQLPKRERATFERVRALLPPSEKVARAGGTVEVDNSWLYAALEEYGRSSSNDKRARALRAAAARLRALDAQLAEQSAASSSDKDAERGRLNAILRDPQFTQNAQRGNALQRFLNDLLEWIGRHLPGGPVIRPGANPRVSQLAQLLVIALCVAALAFVGWRVWSRRARGAKPLRLKRGPRVVLGERLEADQTASDLLAEAERLARAGDLRGAMRKAYVALLCELGDRGLIGLAQHKTNRDYLEAVRRAGRPRLYEEVRPLTSDFELHWYGLRDASEADWGDFSARCRRAIRESGV